MACSNLVEKEKAWRRVIYHRRAFEYLCASVHPTSQLRAFIILWGRLGHVGACCCIPVCPTSYNFVPIRVVPWVIVFMDDALSSTPPFKDDPPYCCNSWLPRLSKNMSVLSWVENCGFHCDTRLSMTIGLLYSRMQSIHFRFLRLTSFNWAFFTVTSSLTVALSSNSCDTYRVEATKR